MMLITALVLILLPRDSHSLQQFPTTCNSRRAFFNKATTAASTIIFVGTTIGGKAANAGIDVSGLRVEQPPATPGRPPNAPPSGPLAGTKLGFQVGGGPRSEEEVRRIDEPRYAAVRKAQGLPPLFLEGMPIEQADKAKSSDTSWMK